MTKFEKADAAIREQFAQSVDTTVEALDKSEQAARQQYATARKG